MAPLASYVTLCGGGVWWTGLLWWCSGQLTMRACVCRAQHPHSAKFYTPALAAQIRECLKHPSAVAYGEVRVVECASLCPTRMVSPLVTCLRSVALCAQIGLDYHYNHSPRDVQRSVFQTQVRSRAWSRGHVLVVTSRCHLVAACGGRGARQAHRHTRAQGGGGCSRDHEGCCATNACAPPALLHRQRDAR